MNEAIAKRVMSWLRGSIDEASKEEIKRLQTQDPAALADAFYRDLEFGTGGLRGVMGVGTNRMNKYTVGMATQGFSNYLKACFPEGVSVAIAHDSRNNSRFFAETTAHVFAANGIRVFLFESLRPTPELSFAIRKLGCKGGVVCTASHNPKEYNGYKAYWDDGSQLVSPHDKNVIAEVEKIQSIEEVRWSGGDALINTLGKEMDEAYIEMVAGLSIYPEVIRSQKDLKIVYTPIHGTGITLVPAVLRRFGFEDIQIVQEQAIPDGNFPTVAYPNPEESEAMHYGLRLAQQMDADILCGTDPDADRLAIGVKNDQGEWVLMNGNQTAVLAFNYLLEARREKGIDSPNDMVVTTIVTTPMIDAIAKQYGVNYYRVLTGFKWIADLIRQKESNEKYVIGGEESFGLMIGDQVRDKDGVSAVALLCEMAAYEKQKGRSLYQKMIDLYVQYGCYQEYLLSITKKGMDGQQQIADMMERFRQNPPVSINGVSVISVLDFASGIQQNLPSGTSSVIDLPRSNVLQFVLSDKTIISARPSGTEPKIKFYVSVHASLSKAGDYDKVASLLNDRIKGIVADLNL
ncbi:MAG: phospho-sugar mutase [Sphingomonadales bacterium]|nr:phospho-sugar mutase [Sphingomonadales bacterium]